MCYLVRLFPVRAEFVIVKLFHIFKNMSNDFLERKLPTMDLHVILFHDPLMINNHLNGGLILSLVNKVQGKLD